MTDNLYMGIDLGTSSVKVIITDTQTIFAQSSQALTVDRPRPLWSEQNPEDWWHATLQAIQNLKKDANALLHRVKAIGLSGQQHGAVLLDKKGGVIRPAILWNDGRSMAQCETLMACVPDFETITGNKIMPGFTAPKLLWLAEHEPENFNKIYKVLLPKDYLRFRLSGDHATDMSDASGTSWLNVGKRSWSSEMLEATGLTESHMPKLYEGSDVTGELKSTIADELGLEPGTIIAAGAGDNAAAAISINVIKPGSAFLSLGTSGTYFVSDDKFSANPSGGVHTFCHCLPNLWHQMNCHLSAASALTWWAEIVQGENEAALIEAAQQQSYLSTPVYFLPYLSGERSPYNNPYATGTFFGMTATTKRAALTQAVLEGVAYNFAIGQDAMLETGTRIDSIAVVGGGARSLYWGEVLATALNQSLIYYKNREVGAALGAARLGYLAHTKNDPLTAFSAPVLETTVKPNQQRIDAFKRKKIKFQQLYQQLTTLFSEENNDE